MAVSTSVASDDGDDASFARVAAIVLRALLDYFRLLFCAHVAHAYAPSLAPDAVSCGLAPWQSARATELLAEHLDGA